MVKENEGTDANGLVDLKGSLKWNGNTHSIATGTSAYFTSTVVICPCACAFAICAGVRIDDPDNFHSCWIVWNNPM